MLKVVTVRRANNQASAATGGAASGTPRAEGTVADLTATLAHDERHLRRRTIALSDQSRILIDLPDPIVLNAGDELELEDGRCVRIDAAEEELYDIRGRDPLHLLQLAWHIGNRHLPAELHRDRILIGRDHVIRTMLTGLGATVTDIQAPFTPTRGAYAETTNHHHHHP